MNYIYGPVTSRRLGVSLGISITPYKYCMFDCVYCQLKNTTKFTLKREEYVRAEDILLEISEFFKNYPDYKKINYITISGSGEPLLNSKIKDIISGIKGIIAIPLALITNSVLLSDVRVRQEVLNSDLILPSLDAFTQEVFEKIDKPIDSSIKIENVIDGLIALRSEFKGKIWLEIMLVKGINDGLEYIREFKEVIKKINPDKIQLNTASRPPSESWVSSPSLKKLNKIKEILGDNCELL